MSTEGRSQPSSGSRVVRRGAIIGAATWGSKQATEDPGQLRRGSEDRVGTPNYAIIGAPTWGPSSSMEDPGQSEGGWWGPKQTGGPEYWEDRRGAEKQTPTPGGVSSTTATWGSAPEKSEDEVERWSGVRSRLDAILGVLTGGRWSSAREGGNISQRPGRDLSTRGKSSEARRRRINSRT